MFNEHVNWRLEDVNPEIIFHTCKFVYEDFFNIWDLCVCSLSLCLYRGMSTSTTTATGGNVTVSPSSGPSEAMKRCARKIQEKLRSKHKQPKKPLKKTKDKDQTRSPKKQNQNHNHIKRRACNIGRKGKTYKTKDDRKLKEISPEQHFARNYLRCSKPGGRSIKISEH